MLFGVEKKGKKYSDSNTGLNQISEVIAEEPK